MTDSEQFAREKREDMGEPIVAGDDPRETFLKAVAVGLCILGAAIFLGLVACLAGVEWVRK